MVVFATGESVTVRKRIESVTGERCRDRTTTVVGLHATHLIEKPAEVL